MVMMCELERCSLRRDGLARHICRLYLAHPSRLLALLVYAAGSYILLALSMTYQEAQKQEGWQPHTLQSITL